MKLSVIHLLLRKILTVRNQNVISRNAMDIQTTCSWGNGWVEEKEKNVADDNSDTHTCGAVTLAVRLPACTSISHAYSRESLPKGRPSAENMACALSWRPDRLIWPSLSASSTGGRCWKQEQDSKKYIQENCIMISGCFSPRDKQ